MLCYFNKHIKHELNNYENNNKKKSIYYIFIFIWCTPACPQFCLNIWMYTFLNVNVILEINFY